ERKNTDLPAHLFRHRPSAATDPGHRRARMGQHRCDPCRARPHDEAAAAPRPGHTLSPRAQLARARMAGRTQSPRVMARRGTECHVLPADHWSKRLIRIAPASTFLATPGVLSYAS